MGNHELEDGGISTLVAALQMWGHSIAYISDAKKAVIRRDGGLICVYIKHSKLTRVDVASRG